MDYFECPECKTKFKLPSGMEGKRVKCSKCGIVSLIPRAEERSGSEDQPFSFFNDEDFKPKTTDSDVPTYDVADDPVSEYSFAIPGPGCSPSDGKAITPYRPEAEVGYWRGVLTCILFPADMSNMVSFLIIWILLAIGTGIPTAGCWGQIAAFIIWAYWSTYKFLIIQSSATGDSSFPQLEWSEGFTVAVVIPALKYGLTMLIVLVPAVVLMFVGIGLGVEFDSFVSVIELIDGGYTYGIPDLTIWQAAFALLILTGLFFWPMVALCVAIGDFDALVRFDLIVLTIIRTFPVYLLTVIMVYGILSLLRFIANCGLLTSIPGYLIYAASMVYLEVVSMQLIGRYYHHFKRRFAWEWD